MTLFKPQLCRTSQATMVDISREVQLIGPQIQFNNNLLDSLQTTTKQDTKISSKMDIKMVSTRSQLVLILMDNSSSNNKASSLSLLATTHMLSRLALANSSNNSLNRCLLCLLCQQVRTIHGQPITRQHSLKCQCRLAPIIPLPHLSTDPQHRTASKTSPLSVFSANKRVSPNSTTIHLSTLLPLSLPQPHNPPHRKNKIPTTPSSMPCSPAEKEWIHSEIQAISVFQHSIPHQAHSSTVRLMAWVE